MRGGPPTPSTGYGKSRASDAVAEFLTFVSHIDPSRTADDALIQRGHRLYKAALERCRAEYGLRYLQPGRFLTHGSRVTTRRSCGSSRPTISRRTPREIPSPTCSTARFDAYKTEVRASFFETHFRAFDRQIVLVDTLGALHAGRTAFEDTERAIADIAACLAAERLDPAALARRLRDRTHRVRGDQGGSRAGIAPRQSACVDARHGAAGARTRSGRPSPITPPRRSFRQQTDGPISRTAIANRWCGAGNWGRRNRGPIVSATSRSRSRRTISGRDAISSCPLSRRRRSTQMRRMASRISVWTRSWST